MRNNYSDTDNVNIDKALTQNDISLGLIYVLTRSVETFPNNRQLGTTNIRVVYEITLRTNAMLANDKNIVSFFSEAELQDWKREHGILDS